MDWSTREGLTAIAEHLGSRIERYATPAAFAVGITPASSPSEIEFPHIHVTQGHPSAGAADLADPVDSDADATLRAQLRGHRPVT